MGAQPETSRLDNESRGLSRVSLSVHMVTSVESRDLCTCVCTNVCTRPCFIALAPLCGTTGGPVSKGKSVTVTPSYCPDWTTNYFAIVFHYDQS